MQRQTRSMERSNSMNRGKRSLDAAATAAAGEDDQPERKRPALASVIVEALKVDSLQKLCSSLEPILRRVVSEEVERALAKLGGPPRIAGRSSSPKRIEGSDGRKLRLQFRSRLSLPLFTGGKVEGEHGASIHIVLMDANTGHVVTSGPESSAKLDIVVLEGDFNNEDDEEWSQEQFDGHVVKEREGKRPLLNGDLQITLKEGVGTLGELTFTDNSSWIRSRKFRLGLKVSSGFCDGVRVREAKTEAFTVKDHRGELYKKHYPPALNDEVWRLEKIGKDGSFHKRLNAAGIYYVEDFLRVAVRDSQKLRSILGSGMSNRMWEALMDHAKTCVLSGKLYVYYPDDSRNVGVVFNNIYELSGLIAGEQYIPADSLSDSQKVYVDTLVKKAYDNWHQVIEYDGKSLLSSKKTSRRSVPSRNELPPMAPVNNNNFSNAVDHHQLSLPSLPSSIPSEQSVITSNLPLAGAGYNNNNSLATSRYRDHTELVNSNSQNQFDNTAFTQQELLGNNNSQPTHHNHIPRNDNGAGGLAITTTTTPHHSSSSSAAPSGFQPLLTSSVVQQQHHHHHHPFNDWSQKRDTNTNNNHNVAADNFMLTEEEIRMRSHEMLENEDMQQLLRIFSMGGGGGGGHHHFNNHHNAAAMNMHDVVDGGGGFSFPSFSMPSPALNFGFDVDRNRGADGSGGVGGGGRAVAGWLKIKAAMRWGFFIRKKAAERRKAQLVELDDD